MVRQFNTHALAFRVTLSEYLDACERLGLDPRQANPDFEPALLDALKATKNLGLAQKAVSSFAPKTVGKHGDPNQAKRLFSDFANEYLTLRCQGLEFKREDETPDANAGRRVWIPPVWQAFFEVSAGSSIGRVSGL